ncbi:DUF4192 domain-containing protein [Dactylosporangium sp. CA-139066]|uniref:DUF4192 domain-containing protein n=1 Tax=Dactylosporangium sp. CA-139066 TaxID=3239930 RepID=UPI003D92F839
MSDVSTPQVLRGPEDLLGMVPYLVGYHPADSIVVLYVQSGSRVRAVHVLSLAAPVARMVDEVLDAARRAGAECVLVVGYGPLPAAATVKALIAGITASVPVGYSCFVADGHYYCLKPGCGCAAVTGIPFDPRATAVAAAAAVRGDVALPSREALLALTAPDPAAHIVVRTAIRRTLRQALADDTRPGPADADLRLEELLDLARADRRLTDAQVARLAVLLDDCAVHRAAWYGTDQEMWQRNLWLDLTRRVPDRYVAVPAALAAWCAWRRGEAHLAFAAARRSLEADPGNRLAAMICTAIHAKLPPTVVAEWPPAAGHDHLLTSVQ